MIAIIALIIVVLCSLGIGVSGALIVIELLNDRARGFDAIEMILAFSLAAVSALITASLAIYAIIDILRQSS